MRSALLPSLIRTLVPLIVGWALSLPITPALLDLLQVTTADATQALTAGVTAVVAGLYYLAVRMFEVYVRPKFGVLLGWASQPTRYTAVVDVAPRSSTSADRGW